MPTVTLDRFGGVLTRGVEAAPRQCPVTCDLPGAYHVDPETFWIVRDCDGLRIMLAFEVRARLRASTAGDANLIAIARYAATATLLWLPGGGARRPSQRALRNLVDVLRRRGCQVGSDPAARLQVQKLLLRAFERFGEPRELTVATATRFFAGLSATLRAPRQRVLEACVDAGLAGEGVR